MTGNLKILLFTFVIKTKVYILFNWCRIYQINTISQHTCMLLVCVMVYLYSPSVFVIAVKLLIQNYWRFIQISLIKKTSLYVILCSLVSLCLNWSCKKIMLHVYMITCTLVWSPSKIYVPLESVINYTR